MQPGVGDAPSAQRQHGLGAVDAVDDQGRTASRQPHHDVGGAAANVEAYAGGVAKGLDEAVDKGLMGRCEVGVGVGQRLFVVVHQLGFGRAGQV